VVIVHELLHLKVPNHGKLFTALLRAYLGKRYNGETISEKGKDPML
jgi:predicted metal-dependent hydrolase